MCSIFALLLGLGLVAVGASVVADKSANRTAGIFLIIAGCVALLTSFAVSSGSDDGGDCLMYTMRGCGHCTNAKRAFREAKIAFTEIEYVPNSGRSPQLMPNGKAPSGYPHIWIGRVDYGHNVPAALAAASSP